MKALNLIMLLSILSIRGTSQSSPSGVKELTGTWIETTDSLEEIKLISPTHVFFFIRNLKTDTFTNAGAGTYEMKGDKYIEYIRYGNFEINDSGYIYDYRVEDNIFHQKGTFTFKDGRQVNIDHHFSRIKTGKESNGMHLGTWNQLSSTFTHGDGSKGSHTNETHIRYQITTPTHWMRISMANNTFENAFGGTYTIDGDKVNIVIEFSSVPHFKGANILITQREEGDKLYWSGTGKTASGAPSVQFEDVFERDKQ